MMTEQKQRVAMAKSARKCRGVLALSSPIPAAPTASPPASHACRMMRAVQLHLLASPPCATVGVQETQSRLFVAGTTTSALRPQLCGYGLSCLVGLNSDFYPLCGFLNGLDTSGRATSGGAPRSCRMPRTISQSPYGFCTQKTWHKLFKPNKKNNWCARFLYIRARGKRLGD